MVMASLAFAGDKVVYTVKKGDTLGQLMYAWRVQGIEIDKLYSWNPDLGTQVKIGQEIVYYLPDRSDQNRQDVEKMSEQEVKKIVKETIAQAEAAKAATIQPVAITPKVPKTTGLEMGSSVQFPGIWKLRVVVWGGLAAFFVLPFIIFYLIVAPFFARKRKKAAEEAKAKANDIILEGDWIKAKDMDGIVYSVWVFKRVNNNWYTPFMTLQDKTKPLFRKKFNDAKKAVIGCMKNPKYAEQVAKLKDSGEILRESNQTK
ncbi:LysM peptidoglycan-binding domain-containing protein [Candidatus Falkowbacteria bacterium]|nr:LysM peptidoglycan-binding domain-containing protein [Candidatus Falkowbacteria bacterium]